MLIHRIKLKNILSFGSDAQEFELRPLNVLIGPNGSGKSNLIEVIGLLRAVPIDIMTPIREGGGAITGSGAVNQQLKERAWRWSLENLLTVWIRSPFATVSRLAPSSLDCHVSKRKSEKLDPPRRERTTWNGT